MSGTLASRFQTRFGYGPGLRVGQYPIAMPGSLPELPGAPAPLPAPPAPTTPAAAPAAPAVSAGSMVGGGDGGGRGESDIGSNRDGGLFGLGPNPGDLSASLSSPSGLGVNVGSVLGGLAGVALGGPVGGLIGFGLGSLANSAMTGALSGSGVSEAPQNTAAMGGGGDNPGGFSDPNSQAAVASMNDAISAGFGPESAGWGGGDNPGGFSDPNSQAAVASMNDAISAGFGPESAGWGGDGNSGGGGHNGGDASQGGTAGESNSDGSGGMGWMVGGYTGPGHPAEPAGTVHRGEVVIPAQQVARYGLRPLMALVEGQVPPSRLAALARG